MKNFKAFIFVSFLFSALTMLLACKKEVISPQDFTAKHFQGSWWLKERIQILERNGRVISRDTMRFGREFLPDSIVRDSLHFTLEQTYSRNNGPFFPYLLDENADQIDFKESLGIWDINYVKMNEVLFQQNQGNLPADPNTSSTVLELFVRKNRF